MVLHNCPHCGETLPWVRDAFCSFCRESLDEIPAVTQLTELVFELQPTGTVDIDIPSPLPNLCILCGQTGELFFRFRVHRKHSMKRFFLKQILGGGLFGGLISDEAFYERPVDLSLPVCRMHIDDGRLDAISGIPNGSGRVTLGGVHPTFVTAVHESSKTRWTELAQRISDAGK